MIRRRNDIRETADETPNEYQGVRVQSSRCRVVKTKYTAVYRIIRSCDLFHLSHSHIHSLSRSCACAKLTEQNVFYTAAQRARRVLHKSPVDVGREPFEII